MKYVSNSCKHLFAIEESKYLLRIASGSNYDSHKLNSSLRVCLYVSANVLITTVSPVKIAEPIEMPLGVHI